MGYGIFQNESLRIAEWGLAVIPVDKNEKTPQIHWPSRPLLPGSKYLDKLRDRFAESNIGILTKPSNLTVVDIDDPSIVDHCIERFGETPMIARSPSGGTHLYFRANGEPCRNLRKSDGIKVDIKGAGAGSGGLIVAPPSKRKDGRQYEFIEGGWVSIPELPTIKYGSLPPRPTDVCGRRTTGDFFLDEPPIAEPTNDSSDIGHRNTSLFDYLRSMAHECETQDELIGLAVLYNHDFSTPLEYAEMATVSRNVWRMKSDGRLLTKGKPGSIIPHELLPNFRGCGDASLLLQHLMRDHGARKGDFFFNIPAMVRSGYIEGWSKRTYIRARSVLIECGVLKCVHQGGHHIGDASKYRLAM